MTKPPRLLRPSGAVALAVTLLAGGCRDKPSGESTPAGGSQAASRPHPPPPSERPRFAWQPIFSVPGEEHYDRDGTKVDVSYAVDVCPGAGGRLLVSLRAPRVTRLNGVETAKPASGEARLLEAQQAFPKMVVGVDGRFFDAVGIPEMVDRAAAEYPDQDLSLLRAAASSGSYFHDAAAARWRSWVELWLVFDPARGNPQRLTGAGAGGGTLELSFDGFDSAPGQEAPRAHLSARSTITGESARRFGAALRESNRDVRGAVREIASLMETETDWPDIRPWRVHTTETVSFDEAQQPPLVEDHVFRFDWAAARQGAGECR